MKTTFGMYGILDYENAYENFDPDDSFDVNAFYATYGEDANLDDYYGDFDDDFEFDDFDDDFDDFEFEDEFED